MMAISSLKCLMSPLRIVMSGRWRRFSTARWAFGGTGSRLYCQAYRSFALLKPALSISRP